MSKRKHLHPDAPLFHADHPRPVTRRDFLRQGLITGSGVVLGGSLLSLFANPRAAQAALSSDLTALAASLNDCSLGGLGGGMIPFICFDLAGGANMIGSNVLVGGQNGWALSPIGTAGYSKMGVPGDMLPGGVEPVGFSEDGTSNGDFTDTTLGLAFHTDSAYLRGILDKTSPATRANTNGAVIPARSENDTGNNPHNPMYGIARAGANGSIVTLVGSQSSESGGNSMAPVNLLDASIRPTKVDRPSDVTGLVDTGNLTAVLSDPDDVKAVMESIVRISNNKVNRVNTQITADAVVRDLVKCGYLKAADIADRFAGVSINPDDRASGGVIVGPTGIFTAAEFDGDGEFRKTASVMKMVIDGYAGAGTVTMGGFDYHTGERATGELRDLRAGRCIGACLQYAALRGVPLMIYVFSDGSLASNGMLDSSVNGRGKGQWTGDNSSTAASFFLVYDPGGRPALLGGTAQEQARHQQIGWMRADASVETASSPAANNVNLLVNTVILNYMALHNQVGAFTTTFPNHGLGSNASLSNLIAFNPII